MPVEGYVALANAFDDMRNHSAESPVYGSPYRRLCLYEAARTGRGASPS